VRAVTVYTFPAEVFVVEGDPEAVPESGRSYGRFAATAAEVAASLRGLDSGAWIGSEGDLFRAQLAELPPHLDTACVAFGQVAGALGFADVLAGAQRQMAEVRADAERTFGSLTEAHAERAALREPTDGEVTVDPSVASAFQEHRGTLEARIGRFEAVWEAELAAASGLRLRVLEAARHSGSVIRAAGRASPTAGQNWIQDRWEKTWRSLMCGGPTGPLATRPRRSRP
jgi:hypothetical protein